MWEYEIQGACLDRGIFLIYISLNAHHKLCPWTHHVPRWIPHLEAHVRYIFFFYIGRPWISAWSRALAKGNSSNSSGSIHHTWSRDHQRHFELLYRYTKTWGKIRYSMSEELSFHYIYLQPLSWWIYLSLMCIHLPWYKNTVVCWTLSAQSITWTKWICCCLFPSVSVSEKEQTWKK